MKLLKNQNQPSLEKINWRRWSLVREDKRRKFRVWRDWESEKYGSGIIKRKTFLRNHNKLHPKPDESVAKPFCDFKEKSIGAKYWSIYFGWFGQNFVQIFQ